MDVIALVIFGCLFALAAVQFILVWKFVKCLKNWETPLLADGECAPAVVILCLRGCDPFLRNCLQGILSQDYPNYIVKIVVDHKDDPAKKLVDEFLAEPHANSALGVETQVLTHIERTCSLKCSSLIQVVESLDESIDIVAQLDADAIPHRTWLRELATALQPADVGVATGNRWYMPTTLSTGSLVRHAWNAAAVVQMYWYSIAWGGSMAIKSAVIRDAGLIERWRRAFCEDTMLLREIGKAGYRVRFVSSLMMVNREDCDITSLLPWVRRQLLTARLYHPFWPAVVAHGFLSMAIPCSALVWALVSWISGRWQIAVGLAACLIAYQLVMTIMLPWMESAVCDIASRRNQNSARSGAYSASRMIWMGLLMQWTYTRALVSCLLLRKVDWRGIEYEIVGPWDISMSAYEPYRPLSQKSTQAVSI